MTTPVTSPINSTAYEVLWLRSSVAANSTLKQQLTQNGFSVNVLESANALQPAAVGPNLAALLVDTEYLSAAAAFRDAVDATRATPLSLLVFGRDDDLPSHLAAHRQRASAFFSSTTEPSLVVKKLVELTYLSEISTHQPDLVVVVDDDASQAQFVHTILERAGFRSWMVTDPLQMFDALRACSQCNCQPHLILMDINMPGASGSELTAIIREHPDWKYIPIIYLSGETDPEKQLEALSNGGDGFITKPIRPNHLISTVRNCIKRICALNPPPSLLDTDPTVGRQRVLQRLQDLRPYLIAGRTTGLFYFELDNHIKLLEQISLIGVDQIMPVIQTVLQEQLQSGDWVSRLGDFCLIAIVQREQVSALTVLAAALRHQVNVRTFHVTGNAAALHLSLSVGVRVLDAEDQDAIQLINEAANACRQARFIPQDASVHIQQHDHAPLEKTGALDDRLLERVMDPENLQILYQPMVPLQGDREFLYQCLLRLRSTNGVVLNAGDFMPQVEQTEKILRLDRWVIYKALVVLRNLQKKHTQPNGLFVSQSLSALRDPQRIRWIEENLTKSRINPRSLVLEFRFPDIASDLAVARDYLDILRQLGIRVSLNSLQDLELLLQDLPLLGVDFIKITEYQIRHYPKTWGQLVTSAHQHHMSVVVSRIEQPELLGQLWSNKVDYIQGNFIQSPSEDLNYDFAGAVLG